MEVYVIIESNGYDEIPNPIAVCSSQADAEELVADLALESMYEEFMSRLQTWDVESALRYCYLCPHTYDYEIIPLLN